MFVKKIHIAFLLTTIILGIFIRYIIVVREKNAAYNIYYEQTKDVIVLCESYMHYKCKNRFQKDIPEGYIHLNSASLNNNPEHFIFVPDYLRKYITQTQKEFMIYANIGNDCDVVVIWAKGPDGRYDVTKQIVESNINNLQELRRVHSYDVTNGIFSKGEIMYWSSSP